MNGIFGMTWDALWHQATTIIVAPVFAFLMPENGYYWPYLLSAVVIAAIAYAFARPLRTFSLVAMLRAAFNPRIWLAKSAKADYRYYIVNGILYPTLAAPIAVTAIGFGLVIGNWLNEVFGVIEEPVMGPVAIRVAYTITFFVLLDFGHYLAHLAQHRIPLLWEFHKVHHSAEVLTPITNGRLHPVDLYIMGTGRGLGAAIATGLFVYLGAGEITVYTVLGAHIGVMAFQLIGNLRHSMVWISYGPLNHILVSPAMHQIHHSTLDKHFDLNCGWAFSFWDRMFGTIYVPKEREEFPMGLGDGTDGTWHDLRTMYVRPVVAAAKLLGLKTSTEPDV